MFIIVSVNLFQTGCGIISGVGKIHFESFHLLIAQEDLKIRPQDYILSLARADVQRISAVSNISIMIL